MGRNTQGVTLIRLSKGEKLQAVERLDASLDEVEDVAGGRLLPAIRRLQTPDGHSQSQRSKQTPAYYRRCLWATSA